MKTAFFTLCVFLTLHNFAHGSCNYQVKFDYSVQGLQVSFNNQSQVGNAKYSWSFGDGQVATNASPKHTFAKAGNYEISLTVISEEGCQVTEKSKVFVFDAQSVAVITNVQNSPEPFAATTTVSFSLAQESTVTATLYDISGKTVGIVAKEQMQAGKNSFVLNRNNIVAGMYVLEFGTNQHVVSHKLTIQ